MAVKKTSASVLKPKGSQRLQARNLDQIKPETASTAAEEPLSTPGQANLTSSSFALLPVWQNLGRVAVWPGASSVMRPNDPYEQEADRVTDQVMCIPEPEPTRQQKQASM